MSLVPDYPDYAQHVATANQIAGTGVPLLTKPAQLVRDFGRAITGGSSFGETTQDLNQPGYSLYVATEFPAAATVPFIDINLTWTDSATSDPIDYDDFTVPGSTFAGGFQVVGNGIAKSDQVTVNLTNLDPAQTATVSVLVNQDSVVRRPDRWHWVNQTDVLMTVPTYTLPSLPADQSVLGILDADTVTSTNSESWLFGMAPGQWVQFTGNTSGVTPGSVSMNVFAAPSAVYGSGGLVLQEVLTTAGFNFMFFAPRAPLLVTVHNNATSGTLTVSGMMTALD